MSNSKYPPAAGRRSGCKVSWLYYKTRPEAEAAKVVAVAEADRLANKGYDFGFQSPGSISEVKQGESAGMFEVCIP